MSSYESDTEAYLREQEADEVTQTAQYEAMLERARGILKDAALLEEAMNDCAGTDPEQVVEALVSLHMGNADDKRKARRTIAHAAASWAYWEPSGGETSHLSTDDIESIAEQIEGEMT